MTADKLTDVARTSLRTKVPQELADHLADIVVKAVLTVKDDANPNELDLHMIEIMHMRHGAATDTRFVDGIVLDHGARHPNMAKRTLSIPSTHLVYCHHFCHSATFSYFCPLLVLSSSAFLAIPSLCPSSLQALRMCTSLSATSLSSTRRPW